MASSSSASSSLVPPPYPPLEWDRILSASQKNLPDEIRRLVEVEGVDPKHANRVGQSALHIASLWGHVEAVQVLIELGANVNAANNITGGTPLHCVAQSSKAKSIARRLKVVDLLLQGGANPSAVDFHGRMPVEYCSCNAYDDDLVREKLQPHVPRIFQAMLERDERMTPETMLQIIQEYEEESANDDQQSQQQQQLRPKAVDIRHHGLTPLSVLIDNLIQQDENDDDDDNDTKIIEKQSIIDWLGILQVLLEHGADPNAIPEVATRAKSATNTTTNAHDSEELALHKVCLALKEAHRAKDKKNRVELLEQVAQLLLQYGAIVPLPTQQQLLHDAARRNQLDFVKFLLQVVKVDVNTKGRQGMTALQFAARSGQVDMVQYLLSSPNINVLLQDDRGQTALDAARANDHPYVVTLLEAYCIQSDTESPGVTTTTK